MSDHHNVHNLPSRRSSTSLDKSRQNSITNIEPGSVTDAVALLSTCLALVKPVGMSGEDAQAWLRIATGEVRHLPTDLLQDACAIARRTCTHHGQIVPAVLKEADERLANRRKIVGPAALPPDRQIEHHPWRPTADELEAIKAEATRNLKA